ncbi:MAG: hypothetical protein E7270_03340 [Lachnospiraceae bacterium]|nr:hypothetical protein [Lachnospiraceae bacterium]
MTKDELINQNKILREEKQKIYQQINDIKQKMEPVYILAAGLESEIKYYSKDIAQDKAWIRSETQSLNNIKYKISEEYKYLSELNSKLEGLYREKSSAYDCKNYDRVSRIKNQIENVKARKRNTVDRIESLKGKR